MKPCPSKRKEITWLALGALEAAEERDLRAHLERCAGCRAHYQEISQLTDALAAVKLPSVPEASENFHRQVARQIRAEGEARKRHVLRPQGNLFWRVVMPLAGICVLV